MNGLPFVTVKALDWKSQAERQVLTDDQGYYRIEYPEPEIKELGQPEIDVSVLDAQGGSLFQSEKKLSPKISLVEVLDMTVDGKKLPQNLALSKAFAAEIETRRQEYKSRGETLARRAALFQDRVEKKVTPSQPEPSPKE